MGKKSNRNKKPRRSVSGQKQAVAATAAGDSRKPRDARAYRPGFRAGSAAGADGVFSSGVGLLAGALIFLISTPAVVGPYGQGIGYMPDVHMAAYIQVGAMVVLSLLVLSTFSGKRMQISISRSPLLLPLSLFYGWAMLSVLWADTKYEAVADALDWSGAFLCGFLVLLLLRNLKVMKLLLLCIVISGTLMALLAIGQFLFGIDWVHQHIVPAATFSNKNMAGQYGVLTFPLALMFFLGAKTRLKIWIFAVVMSLIMTYIFYTRSRGSMVSFLVEVIILAGLLIYLKFRHGHHFFGDAPVKKVALGVSLALFLGLSYLTPAMFGNEEKVTEASLGQKPPILQAEHGGEVFDSLFKYEESAMSRFVIWKNSMEIFKDHFLAGVGLGNWTVHYASYQTSIKPDLKLMENQYHTNAHNDYIEILCELGIIGFALLIWVVVSFFRLVRRLLSDGGKEYLAVTSTLTAIIAGAAVNSVFSFPLKQPVPILMVMVYLAVLSNLYGMAAETGRKYVLPAFPAVARGVVSAVVVLAAVGLFQLQRNWHYAESHYHNALISMERGNYKKAGAEIGRAYEFNPMRLNFLWIKATALLQIGNKESYSQAVEMLERVARAYPNSSNTLFNLSSVYEATDKSRDAIEVLRGLKPIQPLYMGLRRRYALSLLNAGRFEEALKEMEMYRRNWQADYEATSDLLRRERLNNPGYTNERGEKLREKRRVRLIQIARESEQIKRRIQRRNALSEAASADSS